MLRFLFCGVGVRCYPVGVLFNITFGHVTGSPGAFKSDPAKWRLSRVQNDHVTEAIRDGVKLLARLFALRVELGKHELNLDCQSYFFDGSGVLGHDMRTMKVVGFELTLGGGCSKKPLQRDEDSGLPRAVAADKRG